MKTAVFGEDPNWGRIVAAAGRAGVKFNPAKIDLAFDKTRVVHKGQPVGDQADNRAQRVMRKKEYVMTLSLGNQPGRAKLWTTDLTYEYVRINASYTT